AELCASMTQPTDCGAVEEIAVDRVESNEVDQPPRDSAQPWSYGEAFMFVVDHDGAPYVVLDRAADPNLATQVRWTNAWGVVSASVERDLLAESQRAWKDRALDVYGTYGVRCRAAI